MGVFIALAAAATLPDFAPSIALLPEHVRSSRLADKFQPLPAGASATHTLSVPLDWSKPDGAHFNIRYFTDASSCSHVISGLE